MVILACLMSVACPDSSSSIANFNDELSGKLTDIKQIRKQSKRNSNCIGLDVMICDDGNTEVIEGTETPGDKKTSAQKATTKNKEHSTKKTTKTTSPTPTSSTPPKLETEAKKSKSHNKTKEKTDSPAPTENGNGNATDKNETIKAESQTGSESPKAEDAQIGTLNLVAASNSVLAVIAVVLNMLITSYNIHDTINLSSTLFLKKGFSDCLSALGFLLQVPSVVSILNKDTPVSLPLVSYWIVTVSVRMSVFMNCVLGVVGCMNILNPIHQVNRKMITISTILYFLLWTTIASLDVWFYSTKVVLQNKVYRVKSLVLKPEPGFSIPSLVTGFKGNKERSLSQAEVVMFLTPITIPALLCFTFMIFKIFHMRQSRIGIIPEQKKTCAVERVPRASKGKKKESNILRAATTILLVTTIYVLTSALSIVAWLVIYRDELRGGEKIKILSWEELTVIFLSSSTLPLLCSTLTPLTLLLRSSAIRRYLLRNILKGDRAAQKQSR